MADHPSRRPQRLSVKTGASFSLDDDASNDGLSTENGSQSQSAAISPTVKEPTSAVHSSLSSSSDLVILRQNLRERGTSISFNPQVKLEDGKKLDLDARLPKPSNLEHGNTIAESNPIGTGQHDGQHGLLDPNIPIQNRPRRHSETETVDYDPVTGEARNMRESVLQLYHRGEMRHPLLQDTVDELALELSQRRSREQEMSDLPKRTPETSGRTVPPPSSPLNIGLPGKAILRNLSEMTVSPTELSPSPTRPSGPETGSGLVQSRRSISSRSFGSVGSIGRRHRSAANSSAPSPAQSFLAGYFRNETEKAPDPDEEGQQIGGESDIPIYIIGRKIGFGGFSVVREATTLEGERRVVRAVKIVRKQLSGRSEQENERVQTEFEGEINVWRYLRHNYILPLIAVYETDFATFCITQLHMAGTLFDLIRRHRKNVGLDQNRGLEPRLVKRYLWQLASALRYLHEDVRVVHRDVKPENCLLDLTDPRTKADGGKVLLCDFGMAGFVDDERRQTTTSSSSYMYMGAQHRHQHSDEDNQQDHHRKQHEKSGTDFHNTHINVGPADTSTNVMGSIEYCAPELLTAQNAVYNTAADMWAYGCVVYALITCDRAFYHEFQPRLVMMVQKGDVDEEKLENSLCASEETTLGVENQGTLMKEFLRGCLEVKPERRMVISEALSHDWLKEAAETEEDS